jgi:hypothetical protein
MTKEDGTDIELEEDEILKIIIGRIQKNLDKRNRLKEETY